MRKFKVTTSTVIRATIEGQDYVLQNGDELMLTASNGYVQELVVAGILSPVGFEMHLPKREEKGKKKRKAKGTTEPAPAPAPAPEPTPAPEPEAPLFEPIIGEETTTESGETTTETTEPTSEENSNPVTNG
jgi:hypothetical protein